MARRARPLGPADYALLGLIGERPRHGYELAELFAPRGDLGEICAMPRNQLYALLHRLEQMRLIVGRTEMVGTHPPRCVFHLAASGGEAFRQWLDRPVERMREVRMDFLLKLYFSERLPDHDTVRLVDAQLAACRCYLAARVAEQEAAPAGSFARLLGGVRVAAARGTIEWLEHYRSELPSPARV